MMRALRLTAHGWSSEGKSNSGSAGGGSRSGKKAYSSGAHHIEEAAVRTRQRRKLRLARRVDRLVPFELGKTTHAHGSGKAWEDEWKTTPPNGWTTGEGLIESRRLNSA
eukprot:6175756-Pleurochrysis_carterae.AAC.2